MSYAKNRNEYLCFNDNLMQLLFVILILLVVCQFGGVLF